MSFIFSMLIPWMSSMGASFCQSLIRQEELAPGDQLLRSKNRTRLDAFLSLIRRNADRVVLSSSPQFFIGKRRRNKHSLPSMILKMTTHLSSTISRNEKFLILKNFNKRKALLKSNNHLEIQQALPSKILERYDLIFFDFKEEKKERK